MRLLIPLLLASAGALIGAVLAGRGRRLRGGIAGIAGAFAGIWLADALDLSLFGPEIDTLLAMAGGAALAARAAARIG